MHALGTLFVRLEGVELKLPPAAQRLVVYLGIKGPSIERSALAGVLYSESTEGRAQGNLRALVSRTRHLLPDHLASDRTEVRLDGRFWVDANGVDTGDLLSLRFRWRGAFLEGHGVGDTLYDEWVRRKRVRIEQRFTARLHAAIAQAEERADWARCRELAHFLTDFEPWSEPGFRALLRSTYQTSGPASAQNLYDRFASRLEDEVGVAPTEETVALARSLLLTRPSVRDDTPVSKSSTGASAAGPPPPPAFEALTHDHLTVSVTPTVRAALEMRALEEGATVDDIVDEGLRRHLGIPDGHMSDPRTRPPPGASR